MTIMYITTIILQVRSANTYTMYNYSDLRVASGDFLRFAVI